MHLQRAGRKLYSLIFFVLLLVEISIALWVRDDFIRPYLGDFLVVILIYSFLMSIFPKLSISKALIIVLVFSFSVEFFQLINIVEILNFQPPKIIMIVLGSSFSLGDLLAYSLGIPFILGIEYIFNRSAI